MKKNRFKYMYFAAYRGVTPVDSFFENIDLYFKYDDKEKCIKEGKEWYSYNAHDDYLAFFEYDNKYNTITRFNTRGPRVALYYINGSMYGTKRDSLEELKKLLHKGLNIKEEEEQESKFKYMYHVTKYATDAPVDTFFKNCDTFFKYNSMEESAMQGKIHYDINPDYGYLSLFRYDAKHKCITQMYPDIKYSNLYLINGEKFGAKSETIEQLKKLFIQEGKI